MYIKEAFKKIYSGDDNSFSRHLALFSICGIIGLFDAYVITNGIKSISLYETIGYAFAWIVFSLFFIGYETIFLHDRNIPEVDFNSLKIVFNKPLMLIFAVSLLTLTAKFAPQYLGIAFLAELLLAVPLTAIQAGYSYNYNTDDVLPFVKSFSIGEYFSLLFKRILFFICSYIIVSVIIFIVFFIVGFIIGFTGVAFFGHEISDLVLTAGAFQNIIAKLSNYLAEILFVYILSISCLVWDYELIKTKEGKNEDIRNDA